MEQTDYRLLCEHAFSLLRQQHRTHVVERKQFAEQFQRYRELQAQRATQLQMTYANSLGRLLLPPDGEGDV